MSSQPSSVKMDDDSGVDPQFAQDILDCFRNKRRATPARWLYDYEGSQLFDAITSLPEYYPTRTETALLQTISDEMATLIESNRSVVEFGAGSVTKTPLLLRAVSPASFIPIDISGDFLRSSADALQSKFPELPIHLIEADFMEPVALPKELANNKMLGFFPGSTIGNMVPTAAVDLLRSMRSTLGDDSMLLIGFDRIKDLSILLPAYDDSKGITAAFNLNLLKRINRDLDADIPITEFKHVARWNDDEKRIEMHLECLQDINFSIIGEKFSMRRGDTIHTENSHKYNVDEAKTLLRAGGWQPLKHWSDQNEYFSIILASASQLTKAP